MDTDQVQYKYKEEYFQRRLAEEKEELTLTRILEIAQDVERVEHRLKSMNITIGHTSGHEQSVNKLSVERAKYKYDKSSTRGASCGSATATGGSYRGRGARPKISTYEIWTYTW